MGGIVVALTYCVVAVSILVQGLSSRSVTRRALGKAVDRPTQ